MKKKLLLTIALLNYCFCNAQITLLNSFNPSGAGTLCGIGYDPDSSHVWIYGCSASTIQCYSTSGVLLNSFTAPGGSANDVDIEIAPEQLTMNGTSVDKGQILFVNGEVDAAEIYAIDNSTGSVIDTLITGFGTDHVVGGSYDAIRNTFFAVQDNVPGTALENLVAEINPVTGDTLHTFQITDYFDVSFGDIEVGTNGNLFIVSSNEDSIAEFTPTGTFVQQHELPQGIPGLSGIALDCESGQAWVAGNSGTVYHLGNFPCGLNSIKENTNQLLSISDVKPNPFISELSFFINMKQPGRLRLSLTNMLGQEVDLIHDGNADSGKTNFTISAKSLPTGVYFLKAEQNAVVITKRIVCMK